MGAPTPLTPGCPAGLRRPGLLAAGTSLLLLPSLAAAFSSQVGCSGGGKLQSGKPAPLQGPAAGTAQHPSPPLSIRVRRSLRPCAELTHGCAFASTPVPAPC